MTVRQIIPAVLLGLAPALHAQSDAAGGVDYALGNSSYMLLQSPGALFRNPAELATVREANLLSSLNRLKDVSSLSASYFQPRMGTFAAGLLNGPRTSLFGAGYGRTIVPRSAAGAAILFPTTSGGRTQFAVGGSIHLAPAGRTSGIHLGAAVSNSEDGRVHIGGGAGAWITPNVLRVQVAGVSSTPRGLRVGVEVVPIPWISLLAGPHSFAKFSGGIRVRADRYMATLATGPQSISFSLGLSLGETAADLNDVHSNAGAGAMEAGAYGVAAREYRLAADYDDFDNEAPELATRARSMADSVIAVSTEALRQSEAQQDYRSAMRAYERISTVDPELPGSTEELDSLHARIVQHITGLLAAADSLKRHREVSRALRLYREALDLDPENEVASAGIDELQNLAQESLQAAVNRGKVFLRRRQWDEAEREFERVLSSQPGNAQARAGLSAVRKQRAQDATEHADSLVQAGAYLDALKAYQRLLEGDSGNRGLQQRIQRCRSALRPEIDRYFREGLQFYLKERYQSAIERWDVVLLIDPQHAATVEYRNRAVEKLKALERLK